jgi:hypothetical protein
MAFRLRTLGMSLLIAASPPVAYTADDVNPSIGAPAQAGPSGRETMLKVDARATARSFKASASWRLLDASGRERVRQTRVYQRDLRGDGGAYRSKWLLVFDSPAQIKDTALLVWSPIAADAEDDQWLYLPAFRKVRRIGGMDRGESFMGSDFAFEDLTERAVDEDAHAYLRSEEIEGAAHAVVVSTPRVSESPYAKRVHWVDLTNWTVRRIEFYAPDGRLKKTLAARWKQVDGIWTWARVEMATKRTGHRTIVEFDHVVHNSDLSDSIFTKSALRLGVR